MPSRAAEAEAAQPWHAETRFAERGGRLENLQTVFRQEPPNDAIGAFGSRILFMPNGSLFITLGDRNSRDQAQNPGNHLGKLVRVFPDGRPHPDNPKMTAGGPKFGRLAIATFRERHSTPRAAASGRRTWRARRGRDQRTTGGTELWLAGDYLRARLRQAKIGEGTKKPGLEQPIYYWNLSIAPSAAIFYAGDLFPEWKGNLVVSALAGEALHRLELDGEQVVGEEVLLKEFGERMRNCVRDRTVRSGC